MRSLLSTSKWSVGAQLRLILALVAAPLLAAILLLASADAGMTQARLAALMAFAGGGMGAGLIVTRRIAARIRELAESAERCEAADAPLHLPESGCDEVARLARVLNGVLERHQKANAELVRVVREHADALDLQRSVLDNAVDYGLLGDGAGGRILWVNRGAMAMLGLQDAEDALGRTLSDLLPPACEEGGDGGDPAVARQLAEAARAASWSGTLRCRRRDGTPFLARIRISPRRDAEGRVSGRVILLRDVTREEEAERRYQELFHSLQEAVYVTTHDGRFLDANMAMARLVGCSGPEELRRSHASEFYVDAAHRAEWLNSVRINGTVRDHEVAVRRRDGETLTCMETTRVLSGANGGFDLFLGTLVDVTEQRQLELRLLQTQRIEAVGTLASGLAHDFNNILSAIVPNAELIERNTQVPRAARERARTIRAAAARAGDITRRLLSLARREYGSRNAVDLNQVVQESVRLLRPALREGVRVSVVPAATAPLVLGDATGLQQVLVNLLVNARDAILEDGTIRIETASIDVDEVLARRHRGLQPGPHALLSVIDDGVGMTAAQMERIFDPFYTTKESGLGSGLGLSVVYGIVASYRGHVAVDSRPGEGSRFDIYLPRADRRRLTEPGRAAFPAAAR